MAHKLKVATKGEAADPVLTRAVEEDKVSWYKKPNLRTLYFLLFPTCIGIEITSGFDSQMINAVQIVEPWQEYMGNPEGAKQGIISAAYALGAICSLPFVPWVAQRFGRRWSIFGGSCIMCCGAIVQCASQHVAMYIVARWILGFGIPACIVSASALLGELGYPKERPVLTSLFNSCYFIGSIVAAGITFGTMSLGASDWAWRIPSILQCVPSLMQISLIFFIPESPRWLVSKDRREEAFDILVKYHAEGDRQSPFVAAEFAQIESTIKIELESAKLSWGDIVRTAGMRKRLLVGSLLGLFTQWSGNTLLSYYLGDILTMIGFTDSNFQAKINVGKTSWELVNATIIALIVTRFPRRKMYLLSASLLMVVYTCWTVAWARVEITGSQAAARAVLFFVFFYSPCYNIAYNALTYSLDSVGWKYLIAYSCWLLFEVICIYFLWPETQGRTLEELTFLFEDKELQERQSMATEKQLFGGDAASVGGHGNKDGTEERYEIAGSKL
ncbi:hypothetical protein LTR37_005212 [Vermiconidia calcicola]|uniref:Uncharacterized protein n=1 Tax=Vermiconidia calcicola TaxID=1690605 RepID=A0ACC3NKI5_9PEZI|nr:hypothetical protein LTR37_005212 [Vermiconidia calcicola]